MPVINSKSKWETIIRTLKRLQNKNRIKSYKIYRDFLTAKHGNKVISINLAECRNQHDVCYNLWTMTEENNASSK